MEELIPESNPLERKLSLLSSTSNSSVLVDRNFASSLPQDVVNSLHDDYIDNIYLDRVIKNGMKKSDFDSVDRSSSTSPASFRGIVSSTHGTTNHPGRYADVENDDDENDGGDDNDNSNKAPRVKAPGGFYDSSDTGTSGHYTDESDIERTVDGIDKMSVSSSTSTNFEDSVDRVDRVDRVDSVVPIDSSDVGSSSTISEASSPSYGDVDEYSGHYSDSDQSPENSDDDSLNDDSIDNIIPPSPPRSPPSELEEGKLYGLYDFSGPDPSHLEIERNEPVYLINDQDNYWWLIRKLNKEEKIQKRKKLVEIAKANNEFVSDIESIDSLSDDGKIGFVPAECLENYDERLARLNCFKNEEIERFHKNPFDVEDSLKFEPLPENLPVKKNNKKVVFNEVDEYDTDLIGSYNYINDYLEPNGLRSSAFSGRIKDLSPSSESDSGNSNLLQNDLSTIRQQQLQGISHDIKHNEIPNSKSNNETSSEVLSEVYPEVVPLIVKKAPKKNKNLLLDNTSLPSPSRSLTENDDNLKSTPPISPTTEAAKNNLKSSSDLKLSKPKIPLRVSSLSGGFLSSLKRGDKKEKGNSLSSKVLTANHGDLKHSNSISKDYKDKLDNTTKKPAWRSSSGSSINKRIVNSSNGKLRANDEDYPKFYRPNMSKLYSNGGDNDSIGSYSPDTPEFTINSKFDSTYQKEPSKLSKVRQSSIMDRLTKTTSDIQDTLNEYQQFNNYNAFNNLDQNLNDSLISESTIRPDNSEIKRERLDELKQNRREARELRVERSGSRRVSRSDSYSMKGEYSINDIESKHPYGQDLRVNVDSNRPLNSTNNDADLSRDSINSTDGSLDTRRGDRDRSDLNNSSRGPLDLRGDVRLIRKGSVDSRNMNYDEPTARGSISNNGFIDRRGSIDNRVNAIRRGSIDRVAVNNSLRRGSVDRVVSDNSIRRGSIDRVSADNPIRRGSVDTRSSERSNDSRSFTTSVREALGRGDSDISLGSINSRNTNLNKKPTETGIEGTNRKYSIDSSIGSTSRQGSDTFSNGRWGSIDTRSDVSIGPTARKGSVRSNISVNTGNFDKKGSVKEEFGLNSSKADGRVSLLKGRSDSIDYNQYNNKTGVNNNSDDDFSPTQQGEYTPLTSIGSLPRGSSPKVVHDMFLPILGKFDELSEKLAELDDLL